MDLLTQTDLQNLTNEHTDFCVSIFMPSSSIVKGTVENPTKLRDMLKEAGSRLEQAELNSKMLTKYLKPASELANDELFWRDQFESLAVFLHEGKAVGYKLPIGLDEEISISHYCNVLPLLKYFSENGTFYVLSVNEGGCRLFEGDRYSFKEITPNEIKKPKKEVLNYLLMDEEEFYKVKKRGGRDAKREAVIFFGHENEKDDRKVRVLEYLSKIESEVSKKLFTGHNPLILAGSDFNTSIYRGVNSHGNTLAKIIPVSPGKLDIEKLHRDGWALANEYYEEKLLDQKQKYCDQVETALSSAEESEIIKAAKYGRIDTLFVNSGKTAWGALEEIDGKVEISITGNYEDENLNNLAAVYTFRSGGQIIILGSEQMPENVPFCAIFRY